ncbi:hypothetical protein [Paenarthrobacter sp. NPDC058040]|uniref:hypothetical protein n=1 Tax=unclassified Paenarthrobacter TaxID=2634190 RepID=UPI0036D8F317
MSDLAYHRAAPNKAPNTPKTLGRLHRGLAFAPDQSGWAIGVLALGALLAGLAQNVLLTYSSFGGFNLMDDVCISLMFLVALARLAHRFTVPALLSVVWIVACLIALWRTVDESLIPGDSAFFLFRQVCMPVLVIVSGLVMTRREWRWVLFAVVAISILNTAYIALESLGIRLIDPTPFARLSKTAIYPNGLPGYYMSFDLAGELAVRAGGLFLNPPTTGIATGAAAVIAFHAFRSRWRNLLVLALGLATIATISRAGILLMLIGIAGPWVARKLHPLVALPVLGIPVLMAGNNIADLGNSDSHVDGLTVGIEHAFESIIGRGFGYVGNFAGKAGELQEASESLSGIAFSAAGLVPLGIYAVALATAVRSLLRQSDRWENYLVIGALVIAMLAETAGSMNATVPMWLLVGTAFGSSLRNSNTKDSSAPPQPRPHGQQNKPGVPNEVPL